MYVSHGSVKRPSDCVFISTPANIAEIRGNYGTGNSYGILVKKKIDGSFAVKYSENVGVESEGPRRIILNIPSGKQRELVVIEKKVPTRPIGQGETCLRIIIPSYTEIFSVRMQDYLSAGEKDFWSISEVEQKPNPNDAHKNKGQLEKSLNE